jgi:hypothetical protein
MGNERGLIENIWKVGRLEGWKVGRLEGWKVGKLEGWKVGRLVVVDRLSLEKN